MRQATCPAADAEPRRPSWDVGSSGWDTHAHVFGPAVRFPYDANRRYTPPDQTTEQYLATLDRLGLRMGVLVQPSVYGTDNSALLDALERAPGRLKGVVDIESRSVTDANIEAWTRLGVCGVRIWWDGRRSGQWLSTLASRLHGTGWHLDAFCPTQEGLTDLASRIGGLRLPVMIEAMGTPRAGDPVSGPHFQTLLRLLRDGSVWVKLSHPYKIDLTGPPYAAAQPFARAIMEAAPDRVVWGSDWPHPMIAGRMPNDGDLLDLLLEWTGCEAAARQVLETNPARFYSDSA